MESLTSVTKVAKGTAVSHGARLIRKRVHFSAQQLEFSPGGGGGAQGIP
jgi:hypothetical protein